MRRGTAETDTFTIPFNATAQVLLPDAPFGQITVNGQTSIGGTAQGDAVVLVLRAGRYQIEYRPTNPIARPSALARRLSRSFRTSRRKRSLSTSSPWSR